MFKVQYVRIENVKTIINPQQSNETTVSYISLHPRFTSLSSALFPLHVLSLSITHFNFHLLPPHFCLPTLLFHFPYFPPSSLPQSWPRSPSPPGAPPCRRASGCCSSLPLVSAPCPTCLSGPGRLQARLSGSTAIVCLAALHLIPSDGLA